LLPLECKQYLEEVYDDLIAGMGEASVILEAAPACPDMEANKMGGVL
jgi:hypothetical protein